MARTSRPEAADRDARLPVMNGAAATSVGAAALDGADAVADASPFSDEPDAGPAAPLLSKDEDISDGAVVSLVTGAVAVVPPAPCPAATPPARSEAPPEPEPLGFSTAGPGPASPAGPAVTSGRALVYSPAAVMA